MTTGSSYVIESVAHYHCEVGENPLWDDTRQIIYWTDIPRGRLYRYDARAERHEAFYHGEPVGGFTLQQDGSLLLFQENKFSCLCPDGTSRVLVDEIDDAMDRFNDVIADPHGRVFAGTIGSNGRSGGLYRIDLDGAVTCLFKGTGCANGMGFSPDQRCFYWTCSTTRRIFRFDYEPASGSLARRHELVVVPESEGVPDGLTVDDQGYLWSARWNGSAVYRIAPTGHTVDIIPFPVPKVSSVAFGGPRLNQLYVTTAGGSDRSDTADGTLYRVTVQWRGLPEFRSRVLI